MNTHARYEIRLDGAVPTELLQGTGPISSLSTTEYRQLPSEQGRGVR